MRLRVGAASSIGKVRPINEDAYLANSDRGLFVVCDGMGGAAAGEVASRLAVDTIAACLNGDGRGEPEDAASGLNARTRQLGEAIRQANRAILQGSLADHAHAGMGTTVVGVWRGWRRGERRACRRQPRLPRQCRPASSTLTRDHSLVEAQVQAGTISREQSLHSEHQNILLRALGREATVEVDLAEVTVATGDRLLLCTDGLTRMVSDDELSGALERFRGDPQGACDHLVDAANNGGGPDNITVVVVELVSPTA